MGSYSLHQVAERARGEICNLIERHRHRSQCRRHQCRQISRIIHADYAQILGNAHPARPAGAQQAECAPVIPDHHRRRRFRQRHQAAERAGEVRREDALRRLTELAFGRANDAVALALSPERERLDVQGLDLSAVSEFKVTEKGAVEIRFLDRIKALEALCLLLERQADEEGAEDLIRALRGEEK